MVDIRTDGNASVIRNDSMINTLYASRNGIHVITGDAQGMLKVWDIRSSKSEYLGLLHDESLADRNHSL